MLQYCPLTNMYANCIFSDNLKEPNKVIKFKFITYRYYTIDRRAVFMFEGRKLEKC